MAGLHDDRDRDVGVRASDGEHPGLLAVEVDLCTRYELDDVAGLDRRCYLIGARNSEPSTTWSHRTDDTAGTD